MVRCRLDRSLSNPAWTDLFPSCRCHYLKFEGSDHRPILSYLDTTKSKGQHMFRYDRRLKDNSEIKALVAEVWNNASYLSVEARLSLCRKAICKWCKLFQQNSKKNIEELREKLDEAISNLTDEESHIQEINTKLLAAYKSEEEYWKQRSRQLWLTLGDANSGYFHAVTKNRKARNRLSVLENEEGLPCFEEDQISALICSHYQKLFTANERRENGPALDSLWGCVSQEANEALIKDPTAEEIRRLCLPSTQTKPLARMTSQQVSSIHTGTSSVPLWSQRFSSFHNRDLAYIFK